MAQRPKGVEADAILRVLRVPPECEGMRLDRFLPSQLRSTSRTRAQAIISVSAFSEDGRPLRSAERVRGEQHIFLWRPALSEEPPPYPIQTLYEDDELLVVNKPPLMTVHPTARHHRHTVINTLLAERPGRYLSLIHRLDRDTSGVLLLAKTSAADRAFKVQLEERTLSAARAATLGHPPGESSSGKADKAYLALTWGTPRPGLVDLPLEDDPSPLRVKVRIAKPGTGLASRTGVEIIGTAGAYALVRCQLFTGRQHQIRVHLSALGAPIVGDKLYGPDERLLSRAADGELSEADHLALELPRHALHAASHRVFHPFKGTWLELSAPAPEDMVEFWRTRGGDPALFLGLRTLEMGQSGGSLTEP